MPTLVDCSGQTETQTKPTQITQFGSIFFKKINSIFDLKEWKWIFDPVFYLGVSSIEPNGS